jgi:ribosomal protein S18 acetylase RimI-like enzyme
MAIEIRQVGPDSLEQYEKIPMKHWVESVFRIDEIDGGLGGLKLTETPVDKPYAKYSQGRPEKPGEGISGWPNRFDVSHWLFLMAFDGDKAVAGATVAFRSPGASMLQGRDDIAALWNIVVDPDYKRHGLGSRLINLAIEWSRKQGCKQLRIETRNNNVPACRFYAAHGCHLGAIDRYAYADDPRTAHEALLVWYLDL